MGFNSGFKVLRNFRSTKRQRNFSYVSVNLRWSKPNNKRLLVGSIHFLVILIAYLCKEGVCSSPAFNLVGQMEVIHWDLNCVTPRCSLSESVSCFSLSPPQSLSQRPCLPGCLASSSAIYHSHDSSNIMIWYHKPYRIVSWHKAETNMSDLWPLLKDVVASTCCTSQGRIQETNRGCTLCSWERIQWQFIVVKIIWWILYLILFKYMSISEIFTEK